MPHLFTCPHCQTKTQVDDRYSGHAGECVTCGGAIQIPKFALGDSAQPNNANSKKVTWIAGAVVSVILVACLLFALVRVGGETIGQLTVTRERTASMRNLERIADAFNAYAADFGAYPPNATLDPNGVPLHSWRVLILPYLDQKPLYDQFDLNRPWSHPENMKLAYDMPAVYSHPNGGVNTMFSQSAYYLITGPGTLFPSPNAPLGPDRITDDVSQTILAVEGIPIVPSGLWTEPIDLKYASMQGKLGGSPGFELGGLLEGGVAMATSDGRGHFIEDSMDPLVFRSLVTPRGGERLADDTLD